MVSKYDIKIKKLYDNRQKNIFYAVASTDNTETVDLFKRPFLN